MAKFQMINSTNPNTIAEVTAESDIIGFRQNPEWVEIEETKAVGAVKAKVTPKNNTLEKE